MSRITWCGRELATALMTITMMAFAPLPVLAAGPQAVDANPVQALKARVTQPTEVMVLGSEHLSTIDGLQPGHLDGVHAVLNHYAPRHVAVESIASHHIELMLQRPGEYAEVLDQFVGKQFLKVALERQIALAMSPEQARQTLASDCVPLPRTHAKSLIACLGLAAAAYDKAWFDYIAYVLGRHHPLAVLPESMAYAPRRLAQDQNERTLIAARLADARGLDRVHGIDSQDSKALYGPVYAALEPALLTSKAAAAFQDTELVKRPKSVRDAAIRAGNLLPLYHLTNSRDYDALILDHEWRLFVDRDLPVSPSLARLAMWDVRNLEIVGNILRIVSLHPQERMLVVIGASHKPFLDDYLNRSVGVRVRQFTEFDNADVQSSN